MHHCDASDGTGDDDLLVLDPFRGIQIVTPARLLEVLDKSSPEESET